MIDCVTNLTKQQSFRLNSLIKTYNIRLPLSSKIQRYYRQLRKFNYKTQASFTIDQLITTSVIIAEKTQIFYNVEGQIIYGEVFFLNQMIKSKADIYTIIVILQMYLKLAKIKDQQLKYSLGKTIGQLQIGYMFIEEYELFFNKLFCQSRQNMPTGYISKVRSFGWLLLLYVEKSIVIQTTSEARYLIASVIYILMRYTFKYIQITTINLDANKDNKSIISSILSTILSFFKFQKLQLFKKIFISVDNILQLMISNDILKCQNLDIFNFLHPQIITTNYKTLDRLYSKNQSTNSIDLRLFLTNRYTVFTPNKIHETFLNKKGTLNQIQVFKSHKIIDFQAELQSNRAQNQDRLKKQRNSCKTNQSYHNLSQSGDNYQFNQNQNQAQSYREIKIVSPKIKNSPQKLQQQQLKGIHSLITRIMKKKSRRINQNSQQSTIIESIINYYLIQKEKLLQQYQKYNCSDKIQMAFLFYCIMLMFRSISSKGCSIRQQRGQAIIKTSFIQISQLILESIQIEGYYLWLVSNYIIQQPCEPIDIKQIMVQIHQFILNEFLWSNQSIILSISTIYSTCKTKMFAQFFQSLKQHVAHIIKSLLDLLNSKIDIAQIQEDIVDDLYEIISLKTKFLLHKHLVQIILCLAFLHLQRLSNNNLVFMNIIEAYQKWSGMSSQNLKTFIHVKIINQHLQIDQIHLTQFYNQYFIANQNLNLIKRFNSYKKGENVSQIPEIKDKKKITIISNKNKSKRSQRYDDKHQEWKSQIVSAAKQKIKQRICFLKKSNNQQNILIDNKHQLKTADVNSQKYINPDNFQRNQTRIRSRPTNHLANNLNTQKTKQFHNQ